ncbi:MAG TPA: SDR family NAD(P)-dependent oxidoreductase [Polyangia bacterium]|nr:SDR family NAD(P)-dependent oxidoreductase [Polyangia bacterium]
MNKLGGKVALVTGSSRGIGAAIATLFAEHGASVAVHGRDSAALAVVCERIAAAGGRALQVAGDVTRFTEIEAIRGTVEDQLGPVDVLVVNAGGLRTRPNQAIEEVDEEGWRASIEGNLTAAFLTMKSFLPGMKQRRRGTIVTISSAAARRPTPASPIPYAAAKAGVELLTQVVAQQAGPFGVRVNAIAPETIMTDDNERQIPQSIRPALVDTHPVRRLGTPDDVARAALFLASDDASWVSGVILDVAGGAVLTR